MGAKRTSRVARPPSCARPTISSLRKMNRTFSLNNVSDIGINSAPKVAASPAATSVPSHPVFMSNQSIVMPLTQASLAAAEHQLRFNPEGDSMMRMTLLNNANKFHSKYASSNYLSDYSTMNATLKSNMSQQAPLPQKTRSAARRRTPRNVEEFLQANGVQDTDTYLTKGFYVGSMYNLNELAKSAPSQQPPQPQHTYLSAQFNMPSNSNGFQLNPVPTSSSSSSSNGGNSAGGFKNASNLFFEKDEQQFSNMKRRNSIHESTSISMANLNFLNLVSSVKSTSPAAADSMNKSSYYRNSQGYNKQRSQTTAIVQSNVPNQQQQQQYGGHVSDNQLESTASNGSSAPSSDSSSSPNPLHHSSAHNQKPSSLGPLMSAVSKLEQDTSLLSSPNMRGMNGFIEQRFFGNTGGSGGSAGHDDDEDDFDEYEYIERNLGAEPSPHGLTTPTAVNTQLANTTTNTNVTDYYTDESNSCNNDNDYPFNSSKTLCSSGPANTAAADLKNGSYLNVNFTASSFSVGGITPNSQQTLTNGSGIMSNQQQQVNMQHFNLQQQQSTPMHQHQQMLPVHHLHHLHHQQQQQVGCGGGGGVGGGNAWDQASNNSLFSGLSAYLASVLFL